MIRGREAIRIHVECYKTLGAIDPRRSTFRDAHIKRRSTAFDIQHR